MTQGVHEIATGERLDQPEVTTPESWERFQSEMQPSIDALTKMVEDDQQ